MNKEELFEALSDIDDQKIKDARDFSKKKTHSAQIRWAAAAACIVLILTAAIGFPYLRSSSINSHSGGNASNLTLARA